MTQCSDIKQRGEAELNSYFVTIETIRYTHVSSVLIHTSFYFPDIMASDAVLSYVPLLEEIFSFLDFESIKHVCLVSK